MASIPLHAHDASAVTGDANDASTAAVPAFLGEAALEPASGCAMLDSLSRDFGSQCALLELLFTTEIAILLRTCRTWSRWIHEPHALGTRHRGVTPSRFPEYLDCGWIRLPQREIILLPENQTLRIDQQEDAEMQARQARETQQMEFALTHVGPAFFPRMETLIVWLRVPRISDSVLHDSFLALAPRLHTLHCVLPLAEHAVPGDTTVYSILAHVSLLPRLRCLWLIGAFAEPRFASFAALPALTELSDFMFRLCEDSDETGVSWRVTHAQVECLARCEQLAELECGSWTQGKDELDADHACSRIEVLSQAKRPRSSHNASHRTLQSLNLQETVMCASLWSHIAPLSELDSLWNAGWSADLSAAEWSPLASFSRLTYLSIAPAFDYQHGDELALTSANYWPALMQCTSLERLYLGAATLTAEQMQLLTRSLPKLLLLRLVHVRLPLESLACLASLPHLTTLSLVCSPLSGAFANVRPHLPALPNLTQLSVWEPDEFRLAAVDVAEQNAALLARCPKLQLDKFVQTLL